MQDKPALGGERIVLRCPNCRYELTVIDEDVVDYGPVRCGACGTQVKGAQQLQRVLEEAIAGKPNG